MVKRNLGSVERYLIEGKNLKEIKDVLTVLEDISLEDLEIEWEKTYLREGPIYGIEILAFLEGKNEIGTRPINLKIEKAYLGEKGMCNNKLPLEYVKTQEDNAWTEFRIFALNYKLLLYHEAVRSFNKNF